MNKANRVVLFDLGGVLADLGEPAKTIGLDLTEEEFWEIWLNSANVHAFEMGKLAASEFFPSIAAEFGQSDGAAFEDRLRTWHLRLFPGAEEMIRSVPNDCHVALLSNTNAMHWEQLVSATDVFSIFDHLFLSYETGFYKPAPESYEQVIERFDCDPGDVLFLDDSPRNVAAANRLGIEACLTRGIDEAIAVVAGKLEGGRHAH